MLFCETSFIIFFSLCFLANIIIVKVMKRSNVLLLSLVSLFFLAVWGIRDLCIFLIVLIFNYAMASTVNLSHVHRTRRLFFTIAVVVDVLVLVTYKYLFFFCQIADRFASLFNFDSIFTIKQPLLAPLAISFYIFHCISYLYDIYTKKYSHTTFLRYTFYLSFFPHLIAGPIVRGNQLLPQLDDIVKNFRLDIPKGLFLFIAGYFLKVAVADQIGENINQCWDIGDIAGLSFYDAWAVAFLYSCQIFGDFYGYTLMALGLAKLLGYELPDNFKAPYIAWSFQGFWNRWHITLSRFIRDYVYIVFLGGNRNSTARTQVNLLVAMLICGLWHGAQWTFVLWGGLHGLALVIERLFGFTDGDKKPPWLRLPWYVFVQITVVLAWVVFRAQSFPVAGAFLAKMLDLTQAGTFSMNSRILTSLIFVVPVVLHHIYEAVPWFRYLGQHHVFRGIVCGIMLYFATIFSHRAMEFIYFDF